MSEPKHQEFYPQCAVHASQLAVLEQRMSAAEAYAKEREAKLDKILEMVTDLKVHAAKADTKMAIASTLGAVLVSAVVNFLFAAFKSH